MKIYCVRHGEAHSADEDRERALTIQGRADIIKVATHLSKCGIKVVHIMHSPKTRARQTAEIMAQLLHAEQITVCETILDAEAAAQPLVDMIKAWHDDTLLVGHLPFLNKLINALVINDENYEPMISYSPATVVCLEYSSGHRWIIRWILSPTLIT